ncbi:MAG: DoxX family protein [Flavisolibacter sp.]
MKNLLATNANNWPALIARLALGIVVFPHGAQKLFGWFGGYGFEGTMGFLTTQAGLPYIVALLVILIESIASLFVIFGFFTRIAALGIFGLFTGIVFQIHAANGFFMNWAGNQKGEGLEYFLLLLGLALVLIISGGGKASVDAALTKDLAKASA